MVGYHFITNRDRYYKMRWLLQITTVKSFTTLEQLVEQILVRKTPATSKAGKCEATELIDVVVNFLSLVIFVFLLFWGMIMYANEVETKEK